MLAYFFHPCNVIRGVYRPKNTTISCSDIDDCASKPCVHATNCTDLQQDFSCVCESGWKGKTCNDSKIIFYQTIACILKAHSHLKSEGSI